MRTWQYIFIVLFLILTLIIIALCQLPDKNLHIVTCNVGQGDTTLIYYRNIQILTDGGPDKKVLDCLGKYIPFWDRDIELVILTHPEVDHYGGLIEVFRRYQVDNFLYNRISVGTSDYQLLENIVGRGGVKTIDPRNVHKLRLGLIHLDILNPPSQVLATNFQLSDKLIVPRNEINHYSVVSLISFGNFRGLLTGDMPPELSDSLAASWSFGPVDYIKVPHHGSKNGLTQKLLEKVMPKVAIISVGKNNYGQPNKEILDMLKNYGVKTLRTDEVGDVEIVTDGQKFWMKN